MAKVVYPNCQTLYPKDQMSYQNQCQKRRVESFIKTESIRYGKESYQRTQDPSMFDLMEWKDKENKQWNFKISDNFLIKHDELTRIKHRINKSKEKQVSEYNDNYRSFFYSNNMKPGLLKYECEPCIMTSTQNREAYQDKTQENPKEEHLAENQRHIQQYSCEKISNNEKTTYQCQHENPHKETKPQEQKPIISQYDPLIYQKNPDYVNGINRVGVHFHTKYGPDPQKAQKTRRQKRIKELIRDSRQLPNSSMGSIFGLPIWDQYGYENRHTKQGGLVYGNYLLSHNVNPHRGENQPIYIQSYQGALEKAFLYPPTEHVGHQHGRCKHSPHNKRIKQHLDLIFPKKNDFPGQEIPKPNLFISRRIISADNTPKRKCRHDNYKNYNIVGNLRNLEQKTQLIRSKTKLSPQRQHLNNYCSQQYKEKPWDGQIQIEQQRDKDKAQNQTPLDNQQISMQLNQQKDPEIAADFIQINANKSQSQTLKKARDLQEQQKSPQKRNKETLANDNPQENAQVNSQTQGIIQTFQTHPQYSQKIQQGQKSQYQVSFEQMKREKQNLIEKLIKDKKKERSVTLKVNEISPLKKCGFCYNDQKVLNISACLTQKELKNDLQNSYKNLGMKNLSNYSVLEIDPRNYQDTNCEWMNRIPHAGKKIERGAPLVIAPPNQEDNQKDQWKCNCR